MTTPSAGSGYFVSPPDGPGRAVLVLPSWWGLTTGAKETANQLADLGYTTLALDLNAGELPETVEAARDDLAAADMNVIASLVLSSLQVVRRASLDPDAPASVVGYGSGASWALWLSSRAHESVDTVVTFGGTQDIDMSESKARYLCHFAATNDLVDDLQMAELGLALTAADRPFRFEHHADTSGGFADRGDPDFDAKGEAIAWRQTIEFLVAN